MYYIIKIYYNKLKYILKGEKKMLEFNEKLIYTGSQKRTSKNGVEYQLVNYLDDTGNTFSTMAECIVPNDIKQLDEVEVLFKVVPGRYTSLKTLMIAKV